MEMQPETEIGDEDIPSDFFDEFNKEEFIEGLSIIDSWDDGGRKSERLHKSSSVMDTSKSHGESSDVMRRQYNEKSSRSPSTNRLDEFIKPGSRRDRNKTNEAIKKDKEVKVKEYLAKSLESVDNLRPPGTELDGFFDENKQVNKEQSPVNNTPTALRPRSRSRERRTRDSPVKASHRSKDFHAKNLQKPRWSPRRSPRHSPRHHSPVRHNQWRHKSPKPYRGNVKRYSPLQRSPRHASPRRSPRRNSPRHSPRRVRRSRSRSPYKRSYITRKSHRSKSRSPMKHTDRFLYPTNSDLPPSYALSSIRSDPYQTPPSSYTGSTSGVYPGGPSYSYAPVYTGGYNSNPYNYDYGGQTAPPAGIPPQTIVGSVGPVMPPVSVPIPNPVPTPNIPLQCNPAPLMVPAPNLVSPVPSMSNVDTKTPYDALAKLVAEGKISQADYLKLAPNKGASSSGDQNHRVNVLNRCNQALNGLAKLHLPNRLLMNNTMMDVHTDAKYIAPKFCSPLKRQAPIEFLFTKSNVDATAQQNKNLLDSIIASLPHLEKVITRPKKKTPKNMKDAAVQTSKPYCDVCEIRENTQYNETSTSIDPGDFNSAVHTQVVEQDLINSKSVFNPSGSVAGSSSMSIAHLTPAQLVSQLAARAKTLKHPDPLPSNQYQRNPPNSYNYEYDGRGGQQYQNYNNYRY